MATVFLVTSNCSGTLVHGTYSSEDRATRVVEHVLIPKYCPRLKFVRHGVKWVANDIDGQYVFQIFEMSINELANNVLHP